MDKNYTDARTTIAATEKSIVAEIVEIVATLATAQQTAKAGLQAILDQFVGIDGPAMGAQLTASTNAGQLAMLDYPIQNAVATANAALASYNPPAPMPMMPMMTADAPAGS